jgi:hypothetical protein
VAVGGTSTQNMLTLYAATANHSVQLDKDVALMTIDFSCQPSQTCVGVTVQYTAFSNEPTKVAHAPLFIINRADIYQGHPGVPPSGLWPANPFLNNGSYSVTVTQSQFLYGQGEYPSPPGTHGAFEVLVDSGKYANDLYIHDNYFDHSTIFLYSGTDIDGQGYEVKWSGESTPAQRDARDGESGGSQVF